VSSVTAEFMKEPRSSECSSSSSKDRRFGWQTAVAGAFAVAEERVDAMTVRRRDEAAPR